MKKTLACMLLAACVCLTFCGCGAMNTGRDNTIDETPVLPQISPTPLPELLPLETPNAEDGMVNDQDGKIDEGDTGAERNTGKETPREGVMVSPSPNPSSEP